MTKVHNLIVFDINCLVFKCEQTFFEGYTAGSGEAAHFAVGSEDSMAWNNQGQRIFGQCIADRPMD